MDEQVEVDTCLALAWAYDTQDLRVPWDWKAQQQERRTMVSKTQQQGAVYESEFRTECLRRGFEPHDPTIPVAWDFLVTCPAGMLKVQVKGTNCKGEYGSYRLATNTGRSKKSVIGSEVDVVVCYIDPEKAWYIMPNDKPLPKTIKLMAGNKRSASMYEKYRGNWSPFYEKQKEQK
jgi:hypothetical protein